MDPLSVAGTVVGIVSLGIQVTHSLVEFYSFYRNQNSEISHTIKKLTHLLGALEILQDQLNSRKFLESEQSLLKNIQSSIQDCEDDIHELEAQCNKLKENPGDGFRAGARTAARRLAYPFRQSTLQSLEETIDEVAAHLSLALQILQQKDMSKVHDDIESAKTVLDRIRTSQVSSEILHWLKAPDASINYNEACSKRHQGTGLWFIQGSVFSKWLTKPNSFLWLYGFAGCGKSVLCSTVIQHTSGSRRPMKSTGVAFFFFSFSDSAKQDTSAMLRTLVLQLSCQIDGNHETLSRLYENSHSSTPPNSALMACLHKIVQQFDNAYIILDALDESPRDDYRGEMLQALVGMRAWKGCGLHFLVTSRDESDIREALSHELEVSSDEMITLKNESVDSDIASFISESLRDKRRLRKWEKYHQDIEKALIERAQGVFRWVECQFTALESCPRSKRQLDTLLASLPRSLDKTYERMLTTISDESKEDARRLLTLLCCAKGPLTVKELIDGIAVEIGDSARLNIDGRLDNEEDIQQICPGLVETYSDRYNMEVYVRIAHFSVQEYLESDRIYQHGAAPFGVRREKGHAEVAWICLTYIRALVSEPSFEEYPFALYAAKNWFRHYRDADQDSSRVTDEVIQFLRNSGGELKCWLRIWNIEKAARLILSLPGFKPTDTPSTPIYYASLLGLAAVVSKLCLQPDIVSTINMSGGRYGNALQAAAGHGYEKVVQLLLDNGADVNAQGGHYGSALLAAADRGHEETVRTLLERGGDINARNEHYGSALHAAMTSSNIQIVRLLLERGLDVDARGGVRDTGLLQASSTGNAQLAQLLLDKGADINATDRRGQSALTRAAANGHVSVVSLLLANPRILPGQVDYLGHPPDFYAAQKGFLEVFRLMLSNGQVDLAHRDNSGLTLLSVAVRNKRVDLVKLLLSSHKYDVNEEDNFGRSPMWWAARTRDTSLEELLSEHCDVTAVQRPQIEISNPDEFEGPFAKIGFRWCDVCMGYMLMKSQCRDCLSEGTPFRICRDCYDADIEHDSGVRERWFASSEQRRTFLDRVKRSYVGGNCFAKPEILSMIMDAISVDGPHGSGRSSSSALEPEDDGLDPEMYADEQRPARDLGVPDGLTIIALN